MGTSSMAECLYRHSPVLEAVGSIPSATVRQPVFLTRTGDSLATPRPVARWCGQTRVS